MIFSSGPKCPTPALLTKAQRFFTEIGTLRYPFQVVCSASDYLSILATQSSTRDLGAKRSAEFLDRIKTRLESLGWPSLNVTFVGLLTIGKRNR